MKTNQGLLTGALLLLAFNSCKKVMTYEPESEASVSAGPLMPMSFAADDAAFKVMSFNIRHNDPGDPQSLDQRKTLIRQIVVDNNPDVFGLQEFSQDPYKAWFKAQFDTLGYNVHWTVSSVTSGSPKVIFYKRSRFSDEGGGAFFLGSDQRSAMWVVLKDNTNNKKYFFCNSHWGLNSTDRALHSQKLIDSVKYFNTNHYPLIVFGDFNAQPGSTEIEKIKTQLDLTDGLGDDLGDYTFHGWTSTGTSKIDWVMSNREMAYKSWNVITTSYSGHWPSDHWPVMVTYTPAIFGQPTVDEHGTSQSALTTYDFADINGDGKIDKIYRNKTLESGKPRIYLSNGDGTFTYSNNHTASASVSDSARYYYADVNGDGKADLIYWHPFENSGHTRVYLATSGGSLSSTVIDNPGGISQSNATVFHFADIDGDGMADKIYWNPGNASGQTVVYFATGGGNFATAIQSGLTSGSSTTTGTNFYYADVDGDGKADKIMWHQSLNSGKTMVYLSNGDGTFTQSSGFSNSGAGGTATTTKFFFADINGDGFADKIYWNPANFNGIIKAYYSSGTSFQGPFYNLRGPSENTNTKFYFFDISGDGKADQIKWNYTQNDGTLRNYFGK